MMKNDMLKLHACTWCSKAFGDDEQPTFSPRREDWTGDGSEALRGLVDGREAREGQ